MTRRIFRPIILVIITTILSSFTSCQDKSRQELILGKWIMDEQQYAQAQMALDFKSDTATIERILNGQSTFKQSFIYHLTDKDKYLSLQPTDTNQRTRRIEIIELDDKTLTLRSQSPDSSLLILKRQK